MSLSRTKIGLCAGRLVRPALVCVGMLVAPALTASPAAAQVAQVRPAAPSLFFRPGSQAAASELLRLIQTAQADGLDPRRYRSRDASRLVRAAWGGNPQAVARADRVLSDLFVRYAQDLRRAPNVGVVYVDNELRPQAPSAAALIAALAAAPDAGTYLRDMGWMHPYYAQLRRQLTDNPLDPEIGRAHV